MTDHAALIAEAKALRPNETCPCPQCSGARVAIALLAALEAAEQEKGLLGSQLAQAREEIAHQRAAATYKMELLGQAEAALAQETKRVDWFLGRNPSSGWSRESIDFAIVAEAEVIDAAMAKEGE